MLSSQPRQGNLGRTSPEPASHSRGQQLRLLDPTWAHPDVTTRTQPQGTQHVTGRGFCAGRGTWTRTELHRDQGQPESCVCRGPSQTAFRSVASTHLPEPGGTTEMPPLVKEGRDRCAEGKQHKYWRAPLGRWGQQEDKGRLRQKPTRPQISTTAGLWLGPALPGSGKFKQQQPNNTQIKYFLRACVSAASLTESREEHRDTPKSSTTHPLKTTRTHTRRHTCTAPATLKPECANPALGSLGQANDLLGYRGALDSRQQETAGPWGHGVPTRGGPSRRSRGWSSLHLEPYTSVPV